ncbi:transcription antiterminator [Bacillus carboniphilus]|uniref:Transcription antiterminator n=1 Tax=Bacillus carboniphilus TaxID=86663 RepID=A0ABY9JXK4_9BACI|nr:transcription antiterminator [Bacillus carboniphilus]WLR43170.1 transcription antiterminator [Bacillus carboniphilus]
MKKETAVVNENVIVKKVLNNNVIIAEHQLLSEVVLIGKGIGFGKKKDDLIADEAIEKMFVLKNKQQQEQYKLLLPFVDEEMIEVIYDIITYISVKMSLPLNDHIHISLTDHISFAIKRLQKGMDIKNPFLKETKLLYPKEYEVATDVVELLNERLNIYLPEGEIGFIALHIHSATSNTTISEINQFSQLINKLIVVIEDSMGISIDRNSIHYSRLIRHLRYTIDRVKNGETVEEPKKLKSLLKEEYPLCYNTAWKMVKVLEKSLQLNVFDAEVVYLTMHLYRINNKTL